MPTMGIAMRNIQMAVMAMVVLTACAQAQPPARSAIADAEPDVTAQVQSILVAVRGGTLGLDVLSDNARSSLPTARMQAMAAALQPCGATPALELLDRQTKGEDRMYVYRAPCNGKPLIVEIDFNKGSRVNRLAVRPQ